MVEAFLLATDLTVWLLFNSAEKLMTSFTGQNADFGLVLSERKEFLPNLSGCVWDPARRV